MPAASLLCTTDGPRSGASTSAKSINSMKKSFLILFSIVILGVLFRFWQLGNIPQGLNNDEVSYGYNAYSILKTGRDEWGKFLPIDSLFAFGDYKLPVYIYFSVPVLALFDLSAFSARLPSALGGVVAIVLVFFLVRALTKKENIALWSAFFLSISPFHIFISRKAAEHNVAITIVIAAVLLLLHARKHIRLFPVAALFFLLQAFTYTPSRGFALLFFPALLLLWRNEFLLPIFKRQWKTSRWIVVGLMLFFTPVLSTFFGQAGSARLQQTTNYNLVGLYNQVDERRGFCRLYLPDILCQLVYSRPIYRARSVVENYVSHFSTERLFVTATGEFDTYAMSKHGFEYAFLFPLILAGVFWSIRQKKSEFLVPLLWLIISPIPSSLSGPGHAGRMTTMLPSFEMLAGIGIVAWWSFSQSIVNYPLFRKIVVFGFAGIVIWSTTRFVFDYIDYNTRGSRSFKVGNEELFSYLASIEDQYSNIYVTDYYGEPYIFYLFFNRFDPNRQLNLSIVDRGVKTDSLVGTWTKVTKIGKYHFFDAFSEDKPKPGELWVLQPGHNPGVEVKQTINDLRNESVFIVIDGAVLSKYYQKDLVHEIQ